VGVPWNGTGINCYGMGLGQISMSHGQPCLFGQAICATVCEDAAFFRLSQFSIIQMSPVRPAFVCNTHETPRTTTKLPEQSRHFANTLWSPLRAVNIYLNACFRCRAQCTNRRSRFRRPRSSWTIATWRRPMASASVWCPLWQVCS